MTENENKKVGIIFDHLEYIEQLKKYFDLTTCCLPLKISKNSQFCQKFKYNEQELDFIIIYCEVKNSMRHKRYGLDLVKSFRLSGYLTPIVVLIWNDTEKINRYYVQDNPFIISNNTESIAILRLPLNIFELKDKLSQLKPMTEDEFKHCNGIINKGKLLHDLLRIENISKADLCKAKKEFNKIIEGILFFKNNIWVNELLKISNPEQFKNSLNSFRENIKKMEPKYVN